MSRGEGAVSGVVSGIVRHFRPILYKFLRFTAQIIGRVSNKQIICLCTALNVNW